MDETAASVFAAGEFCKRTAAVIAWKTTRSPIQSLVRVRSIGNRSQSEKTAGFMRKTLDPERTASIIGLSRFGASPGLRRQSEATFARCADKWIVSVKNPILLCAQCGRSPLHRVSSAGFAGVTRPV